MMPIKPIKVHTAKVPLMQRLLENVSSYGFKFYVSGTIPIEKVEDFSYKMNVKYQTNLDRKSAFLRKKKGYALYKLFLFWDKVSPHLEFFLLKTEGESFDNELWKPSENIIFGDYELSKMTKPDHSKPVTTWRINKKTYEENREYLLDLVKSKRDRELKDRIEAFYKRAGFAGVRKQVYALKILIEGAIKRFRPDLKEELFPPYKGYVQKQKGVFLTIKQIENQLKRA